MWYNKSTESEVAAMLKRAESKQMKMSFVTLEELMPQEHFLRDLDRLVDFDFI